MKRADIYGWQVEHVKKGLGQAQERKFASEKDVARALRKLKVLKGTQSAMRLSKVKTERISAEDSEDIAAFKERAHEPNLPFASVLKRLKKRPK